MMSPAQMMKMIDQHTNQYMQMIPLWGQFKLSTKMMKVMSLLTTRESNPSNNQIQKSQHHQVRAP